MQSCDLSCDTQLCSNVTYHVIHSLCSHVTCHVMHSLCSHVTCHVIHSLCSHVTCHVIHSLCSHVTCHVIHMQVVCQCLVTSNTLYLITDACIALMNQVNLFRQYAGLVFGLGLFHYNYSFHCVARVVLAILYNSTMHH